MLLHYKTCSQNQPALQNNENEIKSFLKHYPDTPPLLEGTNSGKQQLKDEKRIIGKAANAGDEIAKAFLKAKKKQQDDYHAENKAKRRREDKVDEDEMWNDSLQTRKVRSR